MGTVGAEIDNHELALLYMRTHVAQDEATLLEDVRGNALFGDPSDPGNFPFHRSQTLDYTERTQSTIQLKGKHTIEIADYELARFGRLLDPEIDWTFAHSAAELDSPDKRLFSTEWTPERVIIPDVLEFPAVFTGFDPSGSGFGFAQRIWKEITEEGNQFFLNGKLPFEQWSGEEGYLKLGFFADTVERKYKEDSFFYDTGGSYEAQWHQFWSDVYLNDGKQPAPSDQDVDYTGDQDIMAWYYMLDLPINSMFKVIGGVRHESTDLEITNHPESENAQYLPPGGTGWTRFGPEADVSFSQDDVLPSIGFELEPTEKIKVRASYSETVARQTFKELSPVMQMEFLGADIFVGNPELTMSALENYDLRFDYEPYPGGLFSASWFHKDIKDPIEIVQRFQASLFYTTPVNYPDGWLEGYELEVRQDLGRLSEELEGFSVGANATFIDSEVTLPAAEAAAFAAVEAPTPDRDMTNTPEFLYNLNLTYESEKYGTRVGLFYTVRGDTLVEGGTALGGIYVPDVYEKEYGTLNLGVVQPMGEQTKLSLQIKNLTNPTIEREYRSDFAAGEATKTSYKRGVDVVLSMEHEF
jgi:outer membrane receptor protein involved in Fe transport